MVEVVSQVKSQTVRGRERMERLRKLHQKPGLRVEPANEDMRRLLKHPVAGAFRSEGAREWPADNFTYRRLRDGDIKLVEQQQEEKRGSGRQRGSSSE